MDIRLTIDAATFNLRFELEPPVAEWHAIPEQSDQARTTYRGDGYFLVVKQERAEGHTLVDFTLRRDSGQPFTLRNYILEAQGSAVDLDRVWIPSHLSQWVEAVGLHRLCGDDFGLQWLTNEVEYSTERTMANRGIPVIIAMNRSGVAKLAVGLLDQRMETELRYLVRTQLGSEQSPGGTMTFWLRRPIGGYALHDLTEHRDGFFASNGSSWFDTMQQLRTAYDRASGRPLRASPGAAWEPMWVPWAAPKGKWGMVHQETLGPEELWEMAVLAKELGFRAITNSGSWFVEERGDHIMDDPQARHGGDADTSGWGFPDTIGDFTPSSKFRDMRAFANKMRSIGMTWLPWISPWLVGRKTRVRERLEEAIVDLDFDASHPEYHVATSYLCPRNPITQQYVPELVAGLMRDYELDGFLMDMIEFTTVYPCVADHEHNYDSVGVAMADALARMTEAVYGVNPDALIEFRTRYSNIYNLYHATQHRSSDSGEAGSYDMNRRNCLIMRSYMPPGIAVHTDPQWWHVDESNETVAKMLSTLVVSGVPQVGADIVNMPEDHRRLIKAWLSLYNEHKEAFRSGRMRPIQNDAQYSTILVESGNKAFVSYASYPALKVPLNRDADEVYLFNCTNEDWLYTILSNVVGEFSATIRDYDLSIMSETKLRSQQESLLVDLEVPQGGCVALKRTS